MHDVRALPSMQAAVAGLERTLKSGRLPPTWLLVGPENTGKWALAVELARAILCAQPTPWACDECAPCKRSRAYSHGDLFLLFAYPTGGGTGRARAKFQEDFTGEFLKFKRGAPLLPFPEFRNRYIPAERVGELQSWAYMSPGEGRRKVAIVYEPELILRSVVDKLLKLSEEPPADTTLILVSHRPEGVPQTIRSRSRQLRIPRLGPRAMTAYLKKAGHPAAAVAEAVRQSRGAIGAALDCLTQATEEDPQSEALKMLAGLLDTYAGALGELQLWQWKAERQKATDVLDVWAIAVRDAACARVASPLLGDPKGGLSRKLSGLADPDRSQRAITLIRETQAALATNVHIGVALSALASRLAALGRGEALPDPFWPPPQRV